jgi:hypothetical protein
MRKAARFVFIAVFLLLMSGCGSQPQQVITGPPPPVEMADPVSLSITDSPPAGVTVLFFQLNITGASMATQSGESVWLLGSLNPIPVNVTQLQTESAFLGTALVESASLLTGSAVPVTYTSLSVTFSNPQLTIFNGSGATIGSGANACANNTVCQLTPTATPLTMTFSTAPFPLTMPTRTSLAFMLDVHLDTVIQPDLSVNLAAANGVTISQLPAPPSGAPIPGIGNLRGTIQDVYTNTFIMQTSDGRTFEPTVNSNTTYNYPSSVCPANNFSCLAAGQTVNVGLNFQIESGSLLATEVAFVQPAAQSVVEGNIIQLTPSAGNTLMDLIVQQGPLPPSTISFGQRVTVTVPPSGVAYAIDSGSFAIPNGLSFASVADLVVGQQVSVVVQGPVTTASGSSTATPLATPATTTFTTNSITLEPSQITGSVIVTYAGALSFWLSTNPNYVVPPATSTAPPLTPPQFRVTVQTTAGTTFANLTPDNFSGLAANDVVSVQGWLFSSGVVPDVCTTTYGCYPTTTIAAQSVLGRPGPTPLF